MVMTQERPTTRPLRADARRNRDLIVAAAAELFRAAGMTIQMDAVAHRAGVGVGTVYRHFPTKEALLVELVVHRMELLVDEAEAAMAGEDPAAGMRRFIHGLARIMADDAGLVESLGATMGEPDDCAFYRQELMDRKRALVARAQADGLVRSDLKAEDFDGLMCGMGSAIQIGASPALIAEVLLDGLHVPKSAVEAFPVDVVPAEVVPVVAPVPASAF
jgi:AcrR family transcriptional regulator